MLSEVLLLVLHTYIRTYVHTYKVDIKHYLPYSVLYIVDMSIRWKRDLEVT